jgi:hypothetical protein
VIDAPAHVVVGEAVTVSVSGLTAGGTYRLAFEPTAAHAGRVICERTLDRPYRSGGAGRTYIFRGRVPRTLRCGLRGAGRRTGTRELVPGAYRWVVGRRTGHGTWDRRFSVVVAHVTVTRS